MAFLLLTCDFDARMTGLQQTVNDDGVWRIRRKAGGSSVIEVFRIEPTGHGRILPDEFINWRIKLALAPGPPVVAEQG